MLRIEGLGSRVREMVFRVEDPGLGFDSTFGNKDAPI